MYINRQILSEVTSVARRHWSLRRAWTWAGFALAFGFIRGVLWVARKVDDVLSLLQRGGWSVVDHFDLPQEAWWDDFYGPMEQRIAALRAKYAHDAEALAALDEIAKEPQMHRRSGHHYGYPFFVARRT